MSPRLGIGKQITLVQKYTQGAGVISSIPYAKDDEPGNVTCCQGEVNLFGTMFLLNAKKEIENHIKLLNSDIENIIHVPISTT